MKDLNSTTGDRDDIDVIVEALMRNPENAEDIKSLLRQKLQTPAKVRVLNASKPKPVQVEQEDFWDNFPI